MFYTSAGSVSRGSSTLMFRYVRRTHNFAALKIVKSAAEYTECAMDEIRMLKSVSTPPKHDVIIRSDFKQALFAIWHFITTPQSIIYVHLYVYASYYCRNMYHFFFFFQKFNLQFHAF